MESIIVTAFHGVNRFLATHAGDLLKQFLELILFSVVSYMLLTEWTRGKSKQYEYLLLGFLALVIDNLISTLFLALVVFGNVPHQAFIPYFPVVDAVLELLALLALTNAFIFTKVKRKDILRRMITWEIVAVVIVGIVAQVLWLLTLNASPTALFTRQEGFLAFNIFKLAMLFLPIYVLAAYRKERFTKSIIVAFAVYMIEPLFHIVNFVFFAGTNPFLSIAVHPLPFLSILLFTRVMYLKLADKATIMQELQVAKQKYVEERDVSKLKDEFVSTVTHELKTPLTSMRLYLSLLQEPKTGKLNVQQRKMIRIIEEENVRLSQLITDILQLAKLEEGKDKLKLQRVPVQQIITNSLYYHLAEEKGIRVRNEADAYLVVNVDPEKFKQIFINLFSNAVKYAKSDIVITAGEEGEGWYFAVHNDGPEIPEDKIPLLFNRFYRVEDYMTSEKKGTGLGLAIVKKLVDLHGGTVGVQSILGNGATFRVTFPKR